MSYVYAAIGAIIVALLIALGYQTHELDKAKLAIVERDGKISAMNEKAQEDARAADAAIAEARAEAGKKFEEGKKDAQTEHDRIVAGLNDGTVKLRREWAACETNRLSEGVAAVTELGEAERRRNESAGRIIRAVDECVAQTASLIDDAENVRKQVNGTQK